MSSCWAAKPDARPTFKDLVDRTGDLLSSRAGYLDLHIDKALTVAEEMSTTEYSYVDPDRMFRLIQSLQTHHGSQRATASDNQGPSPSTQQQGSYMYANLPEKTRTSPTTTSSNPSAVSYSVQAESYTQLLPSLLDEDSEYTLAVRADQRHHVHPKPRMKHKVGSKAELITKSPPNHQDFEDITESGYVNTKFMS